MITGSHGLCIPRQHRQLSTNKGRQRSFQKEPLRRQVNLFCMCETEWYITCLHCFVVYFSLLWCVHCIWVVGSWCVSKLSPTHSDRSMTATSGRPFNKRAWTPSQGQRSSPPLGVSLLYPQHFSLFVPCQLCPYIFLSGLNLPICSRRPQRFGARILGSYHRAFLSRCCSRTVLMGFDHQEFKLTANSGLAFFYGTYLTMFLKPSYVHYWYLLFLRNRLLTARHPVRSGQSVCALCCHANPNTST